MFDLGFSAVSETLGGVVLTAAAPLNRLTAAFNPKFHPRTLLWCFQADVEEQRRLNMREALSKRLRSSFPNTARSRLEAALLPPQWL